MVEKIGIITLNGYFNYGNRFQNYATEQILKSMGFEAKTIINNPSSSVNKNNYLNKIITLKKMENIEKFFQIRNKFEYYLNKKEIESYIAKKTNLFRNFSADYLNETDYCISEKNIPKNLTSKFDFFVTGSDQVWNPHYLQNNSSIKFLTFAQKKKRIAYAPSFGVSTIPTEYKDNFKKWILGINKLSVREEDGARIIKDLTGRNAKVLVDPTMMIDKKKWLSMSKKDNLKPESEFLLYYILGRLSKKKKKQISNFAENNNLEIVEIPMGNNWSNRVIGPREFIDYVNSAKVIFTDSYHGTVFSILFRKPFVTFKRMGTKNMNSRIETLLSKFNLKHRLEHVNNLIKNDEKIMKIDFSNTKFILKKERQKTYDYLEESLS